MPAFSFIFATSIRPASRPFPGDKILLYVHGATYPSETAFDLPLGGRSMMDYIAQQGWDVYLVDVRGYGGSTRPSSAATDRSAPTER